MALSGWELLGLVLAGVLVLESLPPLLATARWRHTLSEVLRLSDGQVRFFALLALLLGAALAAWALA
jgi:uncharacterized protein YjeT (DUF2065 family)